MRLLLRQAGAVLLLACVALGLPQAQAAIRYRFTFPEPQHRWMQVEIEFTGLAGPLELRMSRSSPGRYSVHDFAKNVYDVAGERRGWPRAARRARRIRTDGS